jgi:predicted transcriptional regulator
MSTIDRFLSDAARLLLILYFNNSIEYGGELARSTNIPYARAQKILERMKKKGYVRRNDNDFYELDIKGKELADEFCMSLDSKTVIKLTKLYRKYWKIRAEPNPL